MMQIRNRAELINGAPARLLALFRCGDHDLIVHFMRLVESLIRESGSANGLAFMGTLCCTLSLTLGQQVAHAWRQPPTTATVEANMDMALATLSLIHTALNKSPPGAPPTLTSTPSPFAKRPK